MIIKYQINKRYRHGGGGKRNVRYVIEADPTRIGFHEFPSFFRYSGLINPHRGSFIIATSRHGIHKLRVVPVRQCPTPFFCPLAACHVARIPGDPVTVIAFAFSRYLGRTFLTGRSRSIATSELSIAKGSWKLIGEEQAPRTSE